MSKSQFLSKMSVSTETDYSPQECPAPDFSKIVEPSLGRKASDTPEFKCPTPDFSKKPEPLLRRKLSETLDFKPSTPASPKRPEDSPCKKVSFEFKVNKQDAEICGKRKQDSTVTKDSYSLTSHPSSLNSDEEENPKGQYKSTKYQIKSGHERVEFIKTQKYSKDVLVFLMLKALELEMNADMKMIFCEDNKYYGINFVYTDLKNEPKRQYLISCTRYNSVEEAIRKFKEKFCNCRLIVVLSPENQEKDLNQQGHRDDFLDVVVQIQNGKSEDEIRYCSFEKETLKEETKNVIEKLYKKTNDGREPEISLGKREKDVLMASMYSQLEDCFDELYESNLKPLTIDFTKLQEAFRKDLFGKICFRKKTLPDIFVSRAKELESLREALKKSRIAVITGAFGVGKTELAKQYAETPEKSYDNVVWIDCQTKENAMKDFEKLAKECLHIIQNGTDGKPKDVDTIVNQVFNFFQNKRTLFVFDGAIDPDSIFLPPSAIFGPAVHFIITARKKSGWEKFYVIELQEFSEEETKEYLEKNKKKDSDSLQIALRDLERNPWFLSRWVRGELTSKALSNSEHGKEKPVSSKEVALMKIQSTLTEEEERKLGESLEILKKLPNSDLLKKVLEVISKRKNSIEIEDLLEQFENKIDIAYSISTLLDYYFVKIENKRVIMYSTVQLKIVDDK